MRSTRKQRFLFSAEFEHGSMCPSKSLPDSRGDTFENGTLFKEVDLGVRERERETGLLMYHFGKIWEVEGISEKYNFLEALQQGC